MSKQAIVVTGATSGIGKSTCERLAKEGYRVIGVGHRTEPFSVDLELPDKIHDLCAQIASQYDSIGWIINCAAEVEMGIAINDIPSSLLTRLFQVNVIAPYELLRGLWKPLLRGNGGVIN